jgi:hypothetical protein
MQSAYLYLANRLQQVCHHTDVDGVGCDYIHDIMHVWSFYSLSDL